jgi:Nuclease A inhibitor-like protein
MTAKKITKLLTAASEGLLCSSESEYPFETFTWGNVGEAIASTVLKQAGYDSDAPIESASLREFFDNAIQVQDWHGDEERAEVERFQKLIETIESSLKNTTVFKVGSEAEKDVLIVGTAPTGELMGLSTKVVET